MTYKRSRVDTHTVYPVEDVPAFVLEELVIDNPTYWKNQRMGVSTQGISPTLNLYDEKDGYYYLPRSLNIGLPIDDDFRVEGHKGKIDFKGELRDYQGPAIEALVNAEGGILQAGTGRGKTVMALAAIAKVGVTTLILVHKEFLMNQWVDRIKEFLGYDAGIIRGDRWDWEGKKIVVGMLQTFHSRRDEIPDEMLQYFGLVISDEVHRVAAETWQSVVTMFPAKRRWGLTATVKRTDGLQSIFLAHIGPVVYKIEGVMETPKIAKVGVNYEFDINPYRNRWGNKDINISKLVTAITKIPQRNNLILNLTAKSVEKGRKIIVFSERVAHLEGLNEKFNSVMKDLGYTSGLYIGKMKQEERDTVAEECDVLFATYHIAKEGLDIPELDTCVFASPVSNEITVEQSIGRIARSHEGKKDPIVIDIVDNNIDIFQNMYFKRVRTYNRLNYPVHTGVGI